MLDDILYTDQLMLDVDNTSIGAATSVLFEGVSGEMFMVNQVHNGAADGVLYQKQSMQTFILKKGESYYTF